MNQFPSFDPNKDAKLQLGSVRLNMISLGQKSNQVQPGVGYRVTQTPGGTICSPIRRRYSSSVSSKTLPWTPEFFTTGDGSSKIYKARFYPGTVNQVIPSNWKDDFTLTVDEDKYQFVILNITTGSGKVSGVTISIDDTAPSEDAIAKDTPPVSFKIVLGAIGRSSAKMIIDYNIVVLGTEVFRASKSAPTTGQEIFDRWWRWSIQPT